jgi:hypothetical protein
MTTGLSGINCSNGGDMSKAIAACTASAGFFSEDAIIEGRQRADSRSVKCFMSWALLIVLPRHALEQVLNDKIWTFADANKEGSPVDHPGTGNGGAERSVGINRVSLRRGWRDSAPAEWPTPTPRKLLSAEHNWAQEPRTPPRWRLRDSAQCCSPPRWQTRDRSRSAGRRLRRVFRARRADFIRNRLEVNCWSQPT